MRTIVFFDLPNVYSKDKRAYLMFRKFLINEGFIMMQESVYSKIVLNSQQSNALVERIRKKKTKKVDSQTIHLNISLHDLYSCRYLR